jgi:transposase
MSEKGVKLELEVRRFRCRNSTCKKHTFAEQFPELVLAYAQRTIRLAKAQTEVAIKVGGEGGAGLLRKLNMPTSGDTLLRLIRKTDSPEHGTPKVLGVDDWSLRRGKVFGTILVDFEKHWVVDLLEERTAEVLAQWLKHHPGVEIISRDRSTEYASGAMLGAPSAVQVADRWHLLKNLGDCLKDWLNRQYKKMKPDKTKNVSFQARERVLNTEKIYFGRSLGTRQQLFDKAVKLAEDGLPGVTIAHRLGMPRSTLQRWLAQGTPSLKRAKYVPLQPFLPYLHQRWREGITNRKQIFREIVSQGFMGSYASIYDYTNAMISNTLPSPKAATPIKAKRETLLDNLKLFSKKPEELDNEETDHLNNLTTKFPEAKVCYDLVQRFHKLIRKTETYPKRAFRTWLNDVKKSAVIELQKFASGLEQDKAAVEAALTLPWSNGQTEGQDNKLKLIKRQMFGRAKFDLLRQRVLLN